MAFSREKRPTFDGAGTLRVGRVQTEVIYKLASDPAQLRPGPARLRGQLDTEAEIASEAFRVGEGYLTLESGAVYHIKMLALTEGSGTAYFEMRSQG